MKAYEVMELKDLSSDYAMAEGYIIKVLKENIVPKAMISETRLVFEALCYNVFEQRTNPKDPIKVSAFRRLGYLAIGLTIWKTLLPGTVKL